MKTFFKPVLLACLLSLFVFGDLAMAQRRYYDRSMDMYYYIDPQTGERAYEVGPGRNQRMPPQYSEPQRPTPPKVQPQSSPRVPAQPQYQPEPQRPAPPKVQPQPPVDRATNIPPWHPLPPFHGAVSQQIRTIEVRSTFPGIANLPFGIGQGLRFGVGAVNHPGGGVRVVDVIPNSPGHRAGFEVGDVILEINETPINDLRDYANAIDTSPVVMEAKLTSVNDDRVFNRTVELGY